MKFAFPEITGAFDFSVDKVNCLVIENQRLFQSILQDIYSQTQGFEGKCVLSHENKILPISKNLELHQSFVPFSLNQKSLITKITSSLESNAISDENYHKTVDLMTDIEKFLYDISFEMSCDIDFTKVNVSSLLKSVGIEIKDDYTSLGEKLIDYMELVREFDKDKLFVYVNLRSFLSDEEAKLFIDTVLSHCYNVLMIESFEHKRLNNEKRFIIDADLCEIF